MGSKGNRHGSSCVLKLQLDMDLECSKAMTGHSARKIGIAQIIGGIAGKAGASCLLRRAALAM
jgi:hypothetical protein